MYPMCVGACASVNDWRLECPVWESVLSYQVGLKERTQVIRISNRTLVPTEATYFRIENVTKQFEVPNEWLGNC